MLKGRSFLVFLVVFFFLSALATPPALLGQATGRSGRLFSPSVGRIFYEIALETPTKSGTSREQVGTANKKLNASSPQGVPRTATGKRYTLNADKVEQAIVLLNAAMTLDSRAKYVLPDMIRCLVKREAYPDTRYSILDEYRDTLLNLLADYVEKDTDLEVVKKAVTFLLEQLDSREEREKLLEELLQSLGVKNAGLNSELATLLGLLMVEKADTETASFYLMQAYENNKYNRLAFAKLTELAPERIEPAMYLEHLRLALGENPLDLEAALAFAQYAEQLQLYQTAANAYSYCTDLFRFLYPSQPLPSSIYLPWTISCYNTQRNRHRCLQIASELRQGGRFDLLAEAIAGKAAAKIGDKQQANQIFQAIEEKINNQSSIINYQSIAWFYCFVLPDKDKALDWANKAYSIEPDSVTAAAILAYSLVINGQDEWAKSIIENYQRNQVADLAMAEIQLAQDQQSEAIETLKSAIDTDPGSLVAERAKEILLENDSQYIPPVDPDIVLMVLRNSIGRAVVPTFVSPEKIISVELNIRGDKFSYGNEFGTTVVVITNNSSEPLVVSDNGLFTGNIRIDADISGDINKKIPNLVSTRIRPALPVEPGQSLLVPVRLVTGELKQLLLSSPQASLDIEFTAFIDPVTTDQGELTNRCRFIKPAKAVVERPGIKLTRKYLQNRLNSLTRGRQGQKIKAAHLFVGLLMEQHVMANREPIYKFIYADWMPALLKSALLHNLADNDWVVKVHTMAAMLSLPLDFELISAVAENLNDTHWPSRMMAVYLLARNQDSSFGKVLDYSAEHDTDELVRNMAIALGAADPEAQKSAEQPSPDDSKEQLPNSKG